VPWVPKRRLRELGGQQFYRKHTYLPCAIDARWDEMTDEERAEAFKATWWLDSLSDGEWKAILGEDGASKAARSRAKRKLMGWLVVLGHVRIVNPELFDAARREAFKVHREQFEETHPFYLPWMWLEKDLAAIREAARREGQRLRGGWQEYPKEDSSDG
jgi:hypothetical protein